MLDFNLNKYFAYAMKSFSPWGVIKYRNELPGEVAELPALTGANGASP